MSIRRRRWPAHTVPVAPVCILVLICALAVPAGVRPVAAQEPCPPTVPAHVCALLPDRLRVEGGGFASAPSTDAERAAAAPAARSVSVMADATITDLGTLGGGYSIALGINDAGQVVGLSETTSGSEHAFVWTASGGMRDLGTLGSDYSVAWDINAAGQVVGYSSLPGTTDFHAFVWTAEDGMRDLGTLGGTRSLATAINDAGQVVGWSDTASGASHAFIWTAGAGMQDLDTLGGSSSAAGDINEAGQVVGGSETASGASHAFLWTVEAGMQDLGTSDDSYSSSGAAAINDVGQVVGTNQRDDHYSSGTHAFIWTAGVGMQDLGTLGGYSSIAYSINTAGQVVGDSFLADNSSQHAVLWTLTPPVSTVPLDIKPHGCPNRLNTRSQGVTPLVIVGTNEVDVTTIDPTSIEIAGVTPLRSAVEDVATPYTPMTGKDSADDCTSAGPDGRPDLTLKVDTQALVAALGNVTNGQVVVVELTGTLHDGTPIRGEDVVVIKQKKQK